MTLMSFASWSSPTGLSRSSRLARTAGSHTHMTSTYTESDISSSVLSARSSTTAASSPDSTSWQVGTSASCSLLALSYGLDEMSTQPRPFSYTRQNAIALWTRASGLRRKHIRATLPMVTIHYPLSTMHHSLSNTPVPSRTPMSRPRYGKRYTRHSTSRPSVPPARYNRNTLAHNGTAHRKIRPLHSPPGRSRIPETAAHPTLHS